MASTPYPSFVEETPVGGGIDDASSSSRAALIAVGRCRIHPATSTNSDIVESYQAVLNLTIQQAEADLASNLSDDQKSKLKKKYMKSSVALAKQLLTETLQLDVSIIDVEIVLPAADVIRSDGCIAACFLDAGCQWVVVMSGHDDDNDLEAMDAAKIPCKRLMAHFDSSAAWSEEAVVKVSALCGSVSVTLDETFTVEHIKSMIDSINNLPVVVHIDPRKASLSDDELVSTVSAVCRQLETTQGTIALIDPTAKQLGLSYAGCIRTDRPDGLFTTVVCSRSGEALGLVYSSAESVKVALECGRGVYYSRSRGGLWRKGDTSGHIQTLHRLDIDCDGDALRFTVTQEAGHDGSSAAFCHLNTYTCWGKARGLRHLEETLQDRLRSAPAGSYTKRLFDDSQLLRDKLVEEAQELAEADTAEHVAGELADVLYFALTRAAKMGVTIDDAIAELDKRSRKVSRRPGDSKAFRIAAGQAILEKKNKEGDEQQE